MQRAWRSLSAGAVAQESCPDPGRLWEAACGEAGPGEVRRVIEHTATCGACAEAWRLAVEIDPAENAADRQPDLRPARHAGARKPWRVAAWGTVAAAAMVLLVVGLEWREPAAPAPPVFRSAETETAVVRSLVPQETTLPRSEPVLRWQGPEGARYYLSVSSEEGTTVAQVWELEAAEYRLPEEDLAAVPSGARLLWWVEARLASGETSRSETFTVRLE